MLTHSKWAISEATEEVFVSGKGFFFSFDQTAASSLDSSLSLCNKNISVQITRFYEVSAFCEVHAYFEINSRKCDSILWLEETGNVSTKEALQRALKQIHASRCREKTKRRVHHVAESWQPVTDISCFRLLQSFSITVIHHLYSAHSSHCMNGLSRIASACTCSCVCTEHSVSVIIAECIIFIGCST